MLVKQLVTPCSMSAAPIYTLEWRETKRNKVSRRKKQRDGRVKVQHDKPSPTNNICDGWASRPATFFVPKRAFHFYPLLSRTEDCQKTKTGDFENQDHNTKKLNCSGCHILYAAGEGGDGDQLTTRKGRGGGDEDRAINHKTLSSMSIQ